jgi:PTS system beta-glucosides-specific IIC component
MEKKNYASMAKGIVDVIGGTGNIANVTHCMTRLRFQLVDSSKLNQVEAKKIPGVLNLVEQNGEFQFVIGQDVPNLYEELVKQEGIVAGGSLEDVEAAKNDNKPKGKILESIFSFIGGTFSPIIPVLVAGGLTGAVLTLLVTFAGLSTESGTYQVFYAINQAALYFLPVFVGFSAANRLKCNGYLGALLAVILLYSGINGVEGLDFFGIKIQAISYNSNSFPIILGVLFMSVLYKFLQKHMLKYLKTILVPLITMLITVPVTLIVLGPIGNTVGTWLCDGLLALYYAAPAISVAIVGATTCWMVFLGMNNATYVPLLILMAELGSDPLILAGMAAANVAVGGACLAAALIAKSADEKSISVGAGVTALCGITEPGVYGVLFVKKYPLVGAMVGGGIGGFLAGLLGMTQYVVSTPGFISFASYITPTEMGGGWKNLIISLIVMIVAVAISFIVTLIFGKYVQSKAAQ